MSLHAASQQRGPQWLGIIVRISQCFSGEGSDLPAALKGVLGLFAPWPRRPGSGPLPSCPRRDCWGGGGGGVKGVGGSMAGTERGVGTVDEDRERQRGKNRQTDRQTDRPTDQSVSESVSVLLHDC